jgi:hypothetical protein
MEQWGGSFNDMLQSIGRAAAGNRSARLWTPRQGLWGRRVDAPTTFATQLLHNLGKDS